LPFTEEDMRKIYDHCPDECTRTFVLTMRYNGLADFRRLASHAESPPRQTDFAHQGFNAAAIIFILASDEEAASNRFSAERAKVALVCHIVIVLVLPTHSRNSSLPRNRRNSSRHSGL
jgi:hypothetical protein